MRSILSLNGKEGLGAWVRFFVTISMSWPKTIRSIRTIKKKKTEGVYLRGFDLYTYANLSRNHEITILHHPAYKFFT